MSIIKLQKFIRQSKNNKHSFVNTHDCFEAMKVCQRQLLQVCDYSDLVLHIFSQVAIESFSDLIKKFVKHRGNLKTSADAVRM